MLYVISRRKLSNVHRLILVLDLGMDSSKKGAKTARDAILRSRAMPTIDLVQFR